MKKILYIVGIISMIEGVVLDPALYLAPSPPLTTTDDNDATKMWSQLMLSRINKERTLAPISVESTEPTTSSDPEVMEESETFWPSYRSTSLRGIHFPLSFHLSGTYGGSSSSGIYSSGYMSMPGSYGHSGKAVLAGTNYKLFGAHPGLRIFSSDSRPAWGGWGNGKWGNYGKG